MTPPLQTPPLQTPQTKIELTQWDALLQLGWVQRFDFWMAGLLVASWVTGFFWCLFGTPSIAGIGALALGNVVASQLWTVSLVFRCSFFVLQMRAEINTMPAAAAKLALQFQRGT